MKLLLVFMLLAVILGFVTDRVTPWLVALVVGGAIVTTGLFHTMVRFWL